MKWKGCKVWKLKGVITAGIFKELVQLELRCLFMSLVMSNVCVWKNFKECLIEETIKVSREDTRSLGGEMRRWKP